PGHRGRLPRPRARDERPRARGGHRLRADHQEEGRGAELAAMAETGTIAGLIRDRFGLPTEAGAAMPAEGTVAQLLAHRTHRRYRPARGRDAVLDIAVAAGLSSPSKPVLQRVGVIAARARAKRAAMGGWTPDRPWTAPAPLFMVFGGDNRRIRRVAVE